MSSTFNTIMYLKLLQLILIFSIKSCLSQNNELGGICDCNCDVQISVIEEFIDKLESQEKLIKQNEAGILTLQSELLRRRQPRLPSNCMEAASNPVQSGIYKIQDDRLGKAPFTVWCDQETDFGGWLVIQRRVSSDVDFNRNWNQYKDGFGDSSGSYWIGLEKLHALTSSCEQELYIKMENVLGGKYYAKYDLFIIGSEEEDYVLKKVGEYSGNAGDYFKRCEGDKFTTYDRDNDRYPFGNCAVKGAGGWWHDGFCWSIFNGKYLAENKLVGVIGAPKPLKFVQMMIRPTEKCVQRLLMKTLSP